MAFTLAELSSNPTMQKADLFASLGGDWPNLRDNPNRLALAILCATSKYREVIAGNGRPLIIKVPTTRKYANNAFGPFYWVTRTRM
jgi:hypothetical protein